MKNFSWLAIAGLLTGLVAIALGVFSIVTSLNARHSANHVEQELLDLGNRNQATTDNLNNFTSQFDNEIVDIDTRFDDIELSLENADSDSMREVRRVEKQSTDRTVSLGNEIAELQSTISDILKANSQLRQQLETIGQQVSQLEQPSVDPIPVPDGVPVPESQSSLVAGGISDFNAEETLLIGYRDGKRDEASELCRALGVEIVRTNEFGRFFTCRRTGLMTEEHLQKLQESAEIIEYAQPNHSVRIRSRSTRGSLHSTIGTPPPRIAANPNDPDFGRQWALRKINAPVAWQTINSSNVSIAVIDSGVMHGHPDLSDNMLRVNGELVGHDFASEGDDNSNLTFTAVLPGDADPADIMGHGTHVAGIIGACGDNGQGIAGVVWNARILPVKVYIQERSGDSTSHSAPVSVIADAVYYALENGARIINCSWVLPYGDHPALRNAFARAGEQDVLIVCSAGNESFDLDDSREIERLARRAGRDGDFDFVGPIPLMIGDPSTANSYSNIITVAATDSLDRLTQYSNFGKTTVDIAAPGGTKTIPVLSTWNNSGSDGDNRDLLYQRNFGTSIAAPHVAGAAALAWSHPDHRSKSAAEIKSLLIAKARSVETLVSRCRAGGVLDISFLNTDTSSGESQDDSPDDRPVQSPTDLDPNPITKPPFPVPAGPIAREQFAHGLTRYWNGDYRDAIECFDAAIETDAELVQARYFRAFALAQLGLHDNATTALDHSIETETGNLLANWGRLLERIQGATRVELERVRRRRHLGIPTVLSSDMWQHWSKRATHSASPDVPGLPNERGE